MKKLICGIQARSNSTRLPGKIYLPLGRSTVLETCYNTVTMFFNSFSIPVYVLCPSTDKKLIRFLKNRNMAFLIGNEKNLISRYAYAVDRYKASGIFRITSDCPLIDTSAINHVFSVAMQNSFNTFTSNAWPNDRTYLDGDDVEYFSSKDIKNLSIDRSLSDEEKEHPGLRLYMYNRGVHVNRTRDESHIKLSIDTQEDYERVKRIYELGRKS